MSGAAKQNSSFDSLVSLPVVGVTLLVEGAAWMSRAAVTCSTTLQPDCPMIQFVCYGPNCLARPHIEVAVLSNLFEHLQVKSCQNDEELFISTVYLSAHADQTSALVLALAE